jgi:hypothetical protein
MLLKEMIALYFGLDIFCGQKAFCGFFSSWLDSPNRPGPRLCLGFGITLRHTTLGRDSLDEASACLRDLYLTTHKTHNRQASIIPAAFEPAIPASKLVAAGFGLVVNGICSSQYTS